MHLVPTLRVGMQTGAKPVYTCLTNPDHFLSRLTNDCRFLVSYAFPRGAWERGTAKGERGDE